MDSELESTKTSEAQDYKSEEKADIPYDLYDVGEKMKEVIETALKVGKRHGDPVILRIYSRDMYNDGYKFYLSENGVWLTKKVDVRYFEVIND